MPLYTFRCPEGERFESSHPMAHAPAEVDCPHCGMPARRLVSSPRLSRAGTSAYGLIESAERSAHEPEVVTSIAPGGRRRATRYTRNPLHQKLPRP